MSHPPPSPSSAAGRSDPPTPALLLEGLPDARVVMFEAGPQLTGIPGESVRNIADPAEKARAREMSQGPQAGQFRASLGLPEGVVGRGDVHCARGHASDRLRRRGVGPCPDLPCGGGLDERRRHGGALDVRDSESRVQREDPVHRRRRVGRPHHRRPSGCCTCRVPRSPTRRWAGRSGRCWRRSSPASCPKDSGPARCRSPATRSPTARCGGRARTPCSDPSSTPRRRWPRGSSCAI